MRLIPFILLALTLLPCRRTQALDMTTLYSPRNRERERRAQTRYIILHTTEAPKASALRKLRQNGEAHYLVDEAGHVYRLVDRARVAYHAGRSMWNGRTNLDDCSVGIEIVGYHDRKLTDAQYKALRELIGELQSLYRLTDEQVLTHSMVAYGTPNRWHKQSHRGRKRCAMNLASPTVRQRLGLARGPAFDPDVKAGRLVSADPFLTAMLYAGGAAPKAAASASAPAAGANVIAAGRSAWDIARDRYRSHDTLYLLPGGQTLRGTEVTDWRAVPAGTRVVLSDDYRDNPPEDIRKIGADGRSPREIAGEHYNRKTTLYLMRDGQVKRGDQLSGENLSGLPEGTQVLVGYVQSGAITAKRSAFDLCGPRWNSPSTFYRLPDGRTLSGDAINEKTIPIGTRVFAQE